MKYYNFKIKLLIFVSKILNCFNLYFKIKWSNNVFLPKVSWFDFSQQKKDKKLKYRLTIIYQNKKPKYNSLYSSEIPILLTN
jgi:hypothetical protein